MVDFEADDALAAAATKFAGSKRVDQVVICSPDKDLAQCVVDARVVLLDRRREVVLDEAGVIDKFGVAPGSIPDYLALVGDTADGIPGIPRWGAKSTATVLRKFKHLEQIPDDHAKWSLTVRGAASLAKSLSEHREDALLYRTLATLRTDAPIPESLDELRWRGPDWPALESLCKELGERDVLTRVKSLTG